jgi:DNA polymerase IV (DinB-like DNA polymerase)
VRLPVVPRRHDYSAATPNTDVAGRTNATLPGAPETEDRIVCHVDVDCFYAACERLREPGLIGEPVVVGMGYDPGETHGAVATASYEAREHGVESAQAIEAALERLPRAGTAESGTSPVDVDHDGPVGHYRPVDMAHYESVAVDVKAVLHDAAETVREVSVDEAYLDVTPTGWADAEAFGRRLKRRIDEEVGLTASVGVAPTMSAAKVASDHDKPDGLVVVEPGGVADFLAPLDVEAIHGVGPVRARELRRDGIETAGDLAAADPGAMAERFGVRGRRLVERARGDDDRAVEPRGEPKSLAQESAFANPTADADRQRERVASLADALADRARERGVLFRTVGLKVVTPPFDVSTRSRSLPGPVDEYALIERVALDALDAFDAGPVRKLGVRIANLEFTDREQGRLDGWSDGTTGGDRPDGGRTTHDRRSRQSSLDAFADGPAC